MKMLMPFVFAAALVLALAARPAAAAHTTKDAGLYSADTKAVALAKDEVEAKNDKPKKSKPDKDKGKGNDNKGDDGNNGGGNDDKKDKGK